MKGKTMKYIVPQITHYEGVSIIREDLIAGGTKSRFIHLAFKGGASEVCYASSHCGGGQVALAHTAKKLGKAVTIFAAARAQMHPRQIEAQRLGAKYVWVRPGYQSVLNARLRAHCEASGATPAPFGLAVQGATDIIAEAAGATKCKPDVVWVSGGSGLLARSLRQAWPNAEHHVVQVGAKLTAEDVGSPDTIIHEFNKPYAWACPSSEADFSADGHYELKTWKMLKAWREQTKPRGSILFWNACGAPKA